MTHLRPDVTRGLCLQNAVQLVIKQIFVFSSVDAAVVLRASVLLCNVTAAIFV